MPEDEIEENQGETIGTQPAMRMPVLAEVFMLPAQSEEVSELLAALVKATAAFGPVEKSGLNTVPHRYKYSTLDDMNKATKDGLVQNDLSITHQELPITREEWILATKLWHSKSGQWLASYAPIDPMPEGSKGFSSRQEWGKDCSYIKKYQLGAILNLSPEEDSDASPGKQEGGKKQPQKKQPTQKKGQAKAQGENIGELKNSIMKLEKQLKEKQFDFAGIKETHLKEGLGEAKDPAVLKNYRNALQEALNEPAGEEG